MPNCAMSMHDIVSVKVIEHICVVHPTRETRWMSLELVDKHGHMVKMTIFPNAEAPEGYAAAHAGLLAGLLESARDIESRVEVGRP